jgi:hypothetical protein
VEEEVRLDVWDNADEGGWSPVGFPTPSVDQTRSPRAYSGRWRPGKPTRTAYELVSGMVLG